MSQKSIQKPHDKFFRSTFARKETARSFLQTVQSGFSQEKTKRKQLKIRSSQWDALQI